MELIQKNAEMNDYLGSDEYIDLFDASIQKKAKELFTSPSEKERIRAAYEFVRDEIRHSRDINSKRVTVSASEALRYGEGICLSKSLRLAALLRCGGIPAGLCYQRLTSGDAPDARYIIHGLNAVFLSKEKRWIRLDARGNKPGVYAQFSVNEERIAFPCRAECGETDFPTIYASPPSSVMEALGRCKDPWDYRFDIDKL